MLNAPTDWNCGRIPKNAFGMVMVKDIYSGSNSSSPQYLTAVGSNPQFPSQRRNQRIRIVEERWNLLRHGDGQGYYSGSSSGSPQYLIAVGSTIYFRATDGTNGSELWKSDGTSSGTVMVKDISSGSSSSSPGLFAAIGSKFFLSQRPNQRIRIVRWNALRHSNGQGYQQRNAGSSGPIFFTAVGSTLYFRMTQPTESNCGRAMEPPQAR